MMMGQRESGKQKERGRDRLKKERGREREKDIFVGPLCYANYIVWGYCLPITGGRDELIRCTFT